jgi:pimeloyl-ACP methyl ester carboxylesterase
MRVPNTPRFRPTFFLPLSLALALAMTIAADATAQSQIEAGGGAAAPPSSVPADWGPVSINMEDVPYPHPVGFLDLTLYGQNVRKAYMDVAPAATPNGRSVVLLHGGSYYAMYWADTIEALRNEGYRVVAIDLLGWGRSSKPIIPYSLHLHASNIRQLLDHLGIQQAAVVGHSMGGMVATRFAFMYPEVASEMVMVNAIGLTDSRPGRGWQAPDPSGAVDMEQTYQSNLRLEQNRVVDWKPEFLDHVRIRYGWRLSGEWPRLALVQSLNSSARSADTIVHDWPHIIARSLVIAGEEDGPRYPDLARNAAETLPNGELVLFPNVGHNPHLEIPDRFNEELIRFLGAGGTATDG